MKPEKHIENAEFLMDERSKPEKAQAHALIAIAKQLGDDR